MWEAAWQCWRGRLTISAWAARNLLMGIFFSMLGEWLARQKLVRHFM